MANADFLLYVDAQFISPYAMSVFVAPRRDTAIGPVQGGSRKAVCDRRLLPTDSLELFGEWCIADTDLALGDFWKTFSLMVGRAHPTVATVAGYSGELLF